MYTIHCYTLSTLDDDESDEEEDDEDDDEDEDDDDDDDRVQNIMDAIVTYIPNNLAVTYSDLEYEDWYT